MKQDLLKTIESTLLDACGRKILKKADKILKNRELTVCHVDSKNHVHGIFSESGKPLIITEVDWQAISTTPESVPEWTCSCPDNQRMSCPHMVAVVLHYARFKQKTNGQKDIDDEPVYKGLRFDTRESVYLQALTPPEGEIFISISYAFPHIPSKWELFRFNVTLKVGSREYVGNLANLQQLHFKKSLSIYLELSSFSLQDRQIIRFLAINAQPEGRELSLDSEQTAELFHCFRGFRNFTLNGRQINIRRETAEPVLLHFPGEQGSQFRSEVAINGQVLPLKSEKLKVITGRCGCWIGISGEYWWIPATVDVHWLRNFLRSTQHSGLPMEVETAIEKNHNLPLKTLSSGELKVPKKKICTPLYHAVSLPDGRFCLQLSFVYDCERVSPDGFRLMQNSHGFWYRDSRKEQRITDQLINFGFKKSRKNDTDFFLSDSEAVGWFLDKLIPVWSAESEPFLMSSVLAGMCNGGKGLDILKMECSIEEFQEDNFLVKCTCNNAEYTWDVLLKDLLDKRNYLLLENNRYVRVTSALNRFLIAVSSAVKLVDAENNILKVPRFLVPFWVEAAKELPEMIPARFVDLVKELDEGEKDGPNFDNLKSDLNEDVVGIKFKGDLRNYQQQAVVKMKRMLMHGFNPLLADEMGLGKTIQALALIASMGKREKSGPAIVICPTSLIENWAMETTKFLPDVKMVMIHGPRRDALWKKSDTADIIITSYSLISRDIGIFKRKSFGLLILDEAQHIKNPSTVTAKNCKAIKADHKLVLTGTPLENRPEELWSIFDFLNSGLLGSFSYFKNRYGGNTSTQRQSELAMKVAPFILRRKKKEVCFELPEKYEQLLYCSMEQKQRDLYECFLDTGRRQLDSLIRKKSKNIKFEMLTTLMRLRQICCHPELLPEDLRDNTVSSTKTELLFELVSETISEGHKVLLFSQFTSMLKIVREWLDEQGTPYEYLDGSTTHRMDHVQNFNNNLDIPIFLLSLKAGGTGLNLTSADTVIIYDPWWNPAVEMQAADRTHRIGQTKPVLCLKLAVKDSIEEKILRLQKRKQKIFDELIEKPETSITKFSVDDFKFLFQPPA